MPTLLVWALVSLGPNGTLPQISYYSDQESCEAVKATIEEFKSSLTFLRQKCVPVKVPANRLT